MANVNNSFTFFQVGLLHLISLQCRFFTWIALGDVDLYFPLTVATKANTAEGAPT
jgi:hypothetical protein